MKKIFLTWLPMAIVSTILFFTIYAAVQQSIRQSANDPQIQLAEDNVALLQSGRIPELVANGKNIDISQSLDNFVIITDTDGKIVSSNAKIGTKSPVPPKGVFDYAKTHDDDRLTWQPQNGVRLAIVVEKYSYHNTSGYVVVGRNIKEIETRETSIEKIVAAAWIASLILTWLSIKLIKKD